MLVPLGGYREFIGRNGFNSDQLATLLGLGAWVEDSTREFDPRRVLADLRKLWQEAERKACGAELPGQLAANVRRLSGLVGLAEADCRILEFAVLLHNERLLDDTGDLLGHLSSVKVIYALSVILDLTVQAVRVSLGPDGVLARTGLVTVDRGGSSTLCRKLDLLSEHFADSIYSSDTDPVNLLRGMVTISAPPHLALSDFGHVQSMLSLLCPYIRHAVANGRKGVNIFIHGAPGTGKTQLAKVLAQELSCDLFEVSGEDGDGDPVDGERRLRAYRAAQGFLGQQRVLLLFDEVEDVFNDGNNFIGRKSTAQTRKAWMNRMLEENPVPALWLSNSIHSLDKAFIRRFDMVFELPMPTRKQRERIVRDACGDLLGATGVTRIASSEALAPAVVSKAAAVIGCIRDEIGTASASSAIELLIGNTLEAQGHQPIRPNDPNCLPDTYDPAFLRSDADLARIADGLERSRSGRLCLYGPPGTGKTAYGRWLAARLDVPLLVKRASDLMSMWVGENEKNIARTFRQAEREGALLLIDEVDSFLQDRRGAERGWEVSLVNEMLTQMESFAGVFIASTNLMGGLDQAALRRFDLKVKFDFLGREQAIAMLGRYCDSLCIGLPGDRALEKIVRLANLTPGDFAAVVRRSRFSGIDSPEDLVAALESECAVKEGSRAGIGFLQ
ncbi:MAG: ATP-binding protein [Rhodocyclaceae bacterium]|nr:MAG: ATP-binding protein [Rhodocyclaceae bacterium]